MTRERRIIDALLAKTVKNGCTPEEEATAQAKAKEMAAKYGIPLEAPKATMYKEVDLEEFIRRAAARAAAKAAEDMHKRAAENFRKAEEAKRAKAQAKPETKAHTGMKFASVADAARWYLKFNSHLSYAQIAEKVRGHFPHAKTSAASVAWYASKMRHGK
jgi:hypothetical protein